MRDQILRYIRERSLLRAGARVVLAVSGGADSVALLRVLLDLRGDLGIVLAVGHFNHWLRGAGSQADEAFVAELAAQHYVAYFAGHGDVSDHASASKLGIEAAARELRYRWLAQLAGEQHFDIIATAHTLDDQAETVLLKFLRGAGSRGLAGIYPVVERENLRIVRPLLCVSRDEVETYLESLGQEWREDETNLDRRFTRNRVRHDLLPLLEREFNPNIRALLNDAAEISRAEEEYWQGLVERELAMRLKPNAHARGEDESSGPAQAEPDSNAHFQVERRFSAASAPSNFSCREPASAGGTIAPSPLLFLDGFANLPLAFQRRLLKRFAEDASLTLDFAHIDKLLRCALGHLSKAELPSNWLAQRKGGCLELWLPQAARASAADYEYILTVPGEVHVAELGLTVRALTIAEQFAREAADRSTLLNATLIGSELTVRNWHPGDRFWPIHSRSQEKLKRLFAEKHIPAEQRPGWPVVLHGADIVWARGFPIAHGYGWKGEGHAVEIEILQK